MGLPMEILTELSQFMKLYSVKKLKKNIYPNVYFNNMSIVETTSQKHLRLNLDARLTFNDQIN